MPSIPLEKTCLLVDFPLPTLDDVAEQIRGGIKKKISSSIQIEKEKAFFSSTHNGESWTRKKKPKTFRFIKQMTPWLLIITVSR